MGANAILARLHELGVTVTLSGERLRLEPGSCVPPELADELRQHKPEIVAYLREHPDTLPGQYRLKHPSQGQPTDGELEEIVRGVEAQGYVLLWSTVLDDLIAFYKTEADRQRIPPGFVPYSDEELRELFGDGKPLRSPKHLRLIHQAKKEGARVIPNEDEP